MAWNSRTVIYARISLSLALLSAPLSTASATQYVSSPFDFVLYTSDVQSWRDGSKSGLVTDSKGAMAEALDEQLVRSEKEVDIAIYGLDRQQWFLDRLESLKDRNLVVRAVVDQLHGKLGEWDRHNFAYSGTIALPSVLGKRGVIPDLKPDGQPRAGSTMHNKFLVFDRKAVWLGSTNISDTCIGGEYNANTSLLVRSPAVAKLYADEFDQMFSERRTSTEKRRRTVQEPIAFKDGTKVEVFFSPQDSPIVNAVLPFVRSANDTLDIGMFYLTDTRVVDELAKAVRRGVKVRIIHDAVAAAQKYSKVKALRELGIDVKVENFGGKMHMKTAVADHRDTLIGSMNWSYSGDHQNDENVMVIYDNEKLAQGIEAYFDDLWDGIPVKMKNGKIVDPRAESLDSFNSCMDGVDNNHNLRRDGEDYGCRRNASH